jgi:radical SAM protein with 4Fe4S-binding SPASM domain
MAEGVTRRGPVTYFGVEVTKRCNLRCPHCFTDSTPDAHAGVPTDQLAGLLTAIARAGGRQVAFSGGEPLLRRDLAEVMRRGLEAGLESYSLVTNGLIADAARVDQLKRAGLRAVQVSLDGVDAQDHCAVRRCPPIAFYRALRAVRLFQDAGIVVDVAMILTPRNIARAPEMVLLAEALQVRSVRFCTFVPTGRALSEEIRRRFACEPAQLDELFEFMRAMTAEAQRRRTDGGKGKGKGRAVGVLIDHGIGPWRQDGAFRCDSGEAVTYTTSEGDLYPCPGLIFDRYRVGNVYETPIEELLASPALAVARDIGRDAIGEPCASCANPRCSGGCRGAAYAISGSERAAPIYCNVLRRATRPS